MFMNPQIKPKVGDLVVLEDNFAGGKGYAYCVESVESWFCLQFFDYEDKLFYYWYNQEYDFTFSIISES